MCGGAATYSEHHVLREHDRPIEAAIIVGILEPNNPVRLEFHLFIRAFAEARRIGDVEPALLIEGDRDRAVNRGRGGDELDREALRNAESLRREFERGHSRRVRRCDLGHSADRTNNRICGDCPTPAADEH
jgi:hypothetical protein